jgi:hypothetical protein
MKTEEEYAQHIAAMADKINTWRRANAGLAEAAVIQFNFPKTIMLIATIGDGLEKHFLYANGPGLELLKAIGGWEKDNEPTVLMVRVALELADDRKGKI